MVWVLIPDQFMCRLECCSVWNYEIACSDFQTGENSIPKLHVLYHEDIKFLLQLKSAGGKVEGGKWKNLEAFAGGMLSPQEGWKEEVAAMPHLGLSAAAVSGPLWPRGVLPVSCLAAEPRGREVLRDSRSPSTVGGSALPSCLTPSQAELSTGLCYPQRGTVSPLPVVLSKNSALQGTQSVFQRAFAFLEVPLPSQ